MKEHDFDSQQLLKLQHSGYNFSIIAAVIVFHIFLLAPIVQSKLELAKLLPNLENIPVVNFLEYDFSPTNAAIVDFSAIQGDFQDPGKAQIIQNNYSKSKISSVSGNEKKIRTGLISNLKPEQIAHLIHPDAGETIRILKSSATVDNPATRYLNRWQQAIESSASIWFTNQQACLKGDLVMSVSIDANGSLANYAVLLPSSTAQLNQLAIDMVLATSPYVQFPSELAEHFDRLEFIRKWQFLGNC